MDLVAPSFDCAAVIARGVEHPAHQCRPRERRHAERFSFVEYSRYRIHVDAVRVGLIRSLHGHYHDHEKKYQQ
jgi:hypothetical protein